MCCCNYYFPQLCLHAERPRGQALLLLQRPPKALSPKIRHLKVNAILGFGFGFGLGLGFGGTEMSYSKASNRNGVGGKGEEEGEEEEEGQGGEVSSS